MEDICSGRKGSLRGPNESPSRSSGRVALGVHFEWVGTKTQVNCLVYKVERNLDNSSPRNTNLSSKRKVVEVVHSGMSFRSLTFTYTVMYFSEVEWFWRVVDNLDRFKTDLIQLYAQVSQRPDVKDSKNLTYMLCVIVMRPGDVPHFERDKGNAQGSFSERSFNIPRNNEPPVVVSIIMLNNTNVFVFLEQGSAMVGQHARMIRSIQRDRVWRTASTAQRADKDRFTHGGRHVEPE